MGPEVLEEIAFDLKRKGDFDKALLAYAREYQRNESKYVARLCFEQMIDIMLLKYLREQRQFENKRSLVAALESEMRRFLSEMQILDDNFKDYFNRSKRKLFPRGRGKSPFSVSSSLLLRTEKSRVTSVYEYVKEDRPNYDI